MSESSLLLLLFSLMAVFRSSLLFLRRLRYLSAAVLLRLDTWSWISCSVDASGSSLFCGPTLTMGGETLTAGLGFSGLRSLTTLSTSAQEDSAVTLMQDEESEVREAESLALEEAPSSMPLSVDPVAVVETEAVSSEVLSALLRLLLLLL